MSQANAILTIAYRDVLKLLRDPMRILFTFLFPVIFIAVLGGSMQSNLGASSGYNFLTFVFTGVYAQTLFTSTTQGIVSLLEDRENDFSQEIFISPVSRYSIIFGKILGESLVALPQGIGIIIFGLIFGVSLSLFQLGMLAIVGLVACLAGGAFGVILMSNFSSQRTANQVVPFIIFPQYFLAGVFTPMQVLPAYLDVLSRISPMRYIVDLTRNGFYWGLPEYGKVVLASPGFNLLVVGLMFAAFLFIGTLLFVRGERNR